jgi:hypothetical protein
VEHFYCTLLDEWAYVRPAPAIHSGYGCFPPDYLDITSTARTPRSEAALPGLRLTARVAGTSSAEPGSRFDHMNATQRSDARTTRVVDSGYRV